MLTRRFLLVAGLSVAVAGCGDSTGPSDESLIGTWDLSTVNGQSIAPGVFLTYTFTATTLMITDDLDCDQTATYTAANGQLTFTLIAQTGTQCGDTIGDSGSMPYSIEGNSLTITVEDEDLGTGIFVFTKRG